MTSAAISAAVEGNEVRTIKGVLIQMKLDELTILRWQWHSQDQQDMRPYAEILEFIDLQARTFETTFHE